MCEDNQFEGTPEYAALKMQVEVYLTDEKLINETIASVIYTLESTGDNLHAHQLPGLLKLLYFLNTMQHIAAMQSA